MDRPRLSHLAHARHPVAAPLSDPSVDRLLARAVPGRRSVIDLGCGDGTWLLRALRHEPLLTAVGVDLSGEGFASVRAEAAAQGLADRLELVEADASAWSSEDRFDVVLCVGAAHAFGGLEPTLDAVAEHLGPGGLAVVGDGFWEQPPTEQALATLDARPEDLADLVGTVDRVVDLGWLPVEGHVSSLAEWDAYEWSWTGALVQWAVDHPDDPDREQVLAASAEHRRHWLSGYRGTLGFVTLLLTRTPF